MAIRTKDEQRRKKRNEAKTAKQFAEEGAYTPGDGRDPMEKAHVQVGYRLNPYYKERFEVLSKKIMRSSSQSEFEKLIRNFVDKNADKIDSL